MSSPAPVAGLPERFDAATAVSRSARATAAALTLCALSGCATVASHRAEVERTWQAAFVYLPGLPFPGVVLPAQAPPLEPARPTVLYMHACTGRGGQEEYWAQTLAGAGYAVVMPDSFARQYRRANCDPATLTLGMFPQATDFRQEEITYALDRLREQPWVDARNLFLMGHSDGGMAAALWPSPGFKGVIISGWTCTYRGNSIYDGLRTPQRTPVLAIGFETDPWFQNTPASGSCGSLLARRPRSRLLTLPGRGHHTDSFKEARHAVLEFLGMLTAR